MATWIPNPNAANYGPQQIGPWFERVNRNLGQAFDGIGLESAVWEWPRPTETVARGTKTSPREISDTRELANSYVGTVIDWKTYEHAWRASHASKVLLGVPIANHPGRDWVTYTLSRVTLEDLSSI